MPAVKDLVTYGETGFHCLAAAQVKVRYPREAVATGMRILGEGQLSLTKVLMLTDGEVTPRPFKAYLQYYLSRSDFRTDWHIFSCTSQDTLDYSGPKVNEGSKMMLVATGDEKFDLETKPPAELPDGINKAALYCPGCLVVEGPTYESSSSYGKDISADQRLSPYRLVLLVDDLQACLESEMSFLWTWFTRFEPAADVHPSSSNLNRFHVEMGSPVLIDCRMKPWYPGRLIQNPDVISKIDEVWPRVMGKS
jgi:3-polyprenyl-4-hydroxybenzoate decarboxylase